MLNALFRVGLLSYLWVATIGMEKGTLIQHLEAIIICEESSTNVNNNKVILDIYPMIKGEKKKVKNPQWTLTN